MAETSQLAAITTASAGSAGKSDRSFFRNVATLLSGTAVAQIIPIAATPLLTRVYEPSQFGQFGLFLSMVTLCAVAATMRYSFAILLPDKQEQALELVAVCFAITGALAVMLSVAILPFTSFWRTLFHLENSARWLVLVPLSTVLSGLQLALYALANRGREYKAMSISKVAQAGGTVLGSLLLAWLFAMEELGLVWGYVIGQLGAVFTLAVINKRHLSEFLELNGAGIRAAAARYRNFALVSLPAAFLNALTNQAPVFFLAWFFSEAIVGQYNLTFTATLGPLSMISVAILDVFKERAARDYAATGSCRPIFIKAAKSLALVGAPLLILLYPFAPWLFALVFGAEWRHAGEITQILIPFFIARFIVSPLSYVFYIAERQKAEFIWQASVLVLVASAFLVGAGQNSHILALKLFTWAYTLMYCVYFALSYTFSHKGTRGTLKPQIT